MFDVGQGLRQGYVLSALIFNIVFTAVLCLAEKGFIADAAIMDSIVQLQRKENGENKTGKTRVDKVSRQGGRRTRPMHCGECFTPTFRGWYHDHQAGWRG